MRCLILSLFLFSFSAEAAVLWEKKGVPVRREEGHWVSDWVEFSLPEGLVGFQLLVFGSPEASLHISDLIDPKGEVYVNGDGAGDPPRMRRYGQPVLKNVVSLNRSEAVVPGLGTLLVPNNPVLPSPPAGKWRMRSHHLNEPKRKEVDFLVIAKKEAKAGKVSVRAWVAQGSYWAKREGRVEALLAEAAEIFGSAGITLDLRGIETLAGSPEKPMEVPRQMAEIALEKNDPGAINLYFMGPMEYQNKPVNGRACIGGPVNIPYAHGCFVSLYASMEADEYTVSQQGKVLAHELGHYLGLFHTRDDGYQIIKVMQDPFDDTPPTVTGTNLMDPGIHRQKPVLSPQQKQWLLLSPAVEP